MKDYKLGDKVRVSDYIDTDYDEAEEKIFVYQRDGFTYCIEEGYEEDFNENGEDIGINRWPYIIEKPIEYTLKGDELVLVLKYMKVGVSPKEHNKITGIGQRIAESLGL